MVAIARSTVPVHSLVDDDEFGAAVAAAIWHGWVTGPLSGFLSRPQSVRNPAMATELPMANTIAKASAPMIRRKPGAVVRVRVIHPSSEHSVISGCVSTTALLC